MLLGLVYRVPDNLIVPVGVLLSNTMMEKRSSLSGHIDEQETETYVNFTNNLKNK